MSLAKEFQLALPTGIVGLFVRVFSLNSCLTFFFSFLVEKKGKKEEGNTTVTLMECVETRHKLITLSFRPDAMAEARPIMYKKKAKRMIRKKKKSSRLKNKNKNKK
jgi:hypothetical protein